MLLLASDSNLQPSAQEVCIPMDLAITYDSVSYILLITAKYRTVTID